MGNTLNNTIHIAEKEFTSLLNSRLVLIIMALYLIMFISSIFTITYPFFNGMPSNMSNSEFKAQKVIVLLSYSLCTYGSLVAVVLGFVSMSEEINGRALNTLLVKPVYRDTIINGKLLGALGFSLCLFLFTTVLYVLFMFVYFGVIMSDFSNLLSIYIPSFVNSLPLVFVISLLCFFFFYALSILYTLLFKERNFALFIGILSWIFLFLVLNGITFASYLAYFFHDSSLEMAISGLSPLTMLYLILGDINLASSFNKNWFEFFKLTIYSIVTVIAAYIVFIRRDVA
jgi:ABC-2 type transport system permease protein